MNVPTRESPEPLLVAGLLPEVEASLLDLLRSLAPADWDRPTGVPGWTVRHIAAHLLDTAVRKLTLVRDGAMPAGPAPAPGEVVALVNRLNAEGVAWYGRLSPPVLVSLLETVSRESCAFHQALDPFATAVFAVSWAVEDVSLNWFDTARELTERWLHQQQIRDAVGRPGIQVPRWYHPVLDCFMRSLPFAYRSVPGAPGTRVEVRVAGDCGGSWFLHRGQAWELVRSGPAGAGLEIPQEIAWRVFTKGIGREEAEGRCRLWGDPALVRPVLAALAIVG
jgi:uncharacterized protein (TIGR03083 family)